MRFEPWPYQTRAINWIHEHPSCGLLLDMGLGKTVITLTALNDLIMLGEAERILVIAPLRVAEDTWSRECAKWDHLQHLRIAKVLGPAEDRLRALNSPADIWVINRENVPWLVNQVGKGHWPFGTVVIDELSSFKSPSSQRFKSLKKILHQTRRVIGLTGTPAPNGLLDLWSQIYLLDKGERFGKTITGYRQAHFDAGLKVHNVVVKWRLKKGHDRIIYGLIKDLCLSMSAADYLDLPPRLDEECIINLPVQSRQVYDRLETELYAELGGTEITAGNAAVLTGKLLQAGNGAIYDCMGHVTPLHDAKLDALDDLVEAANGNPLLVYYSYQHDLERILSRHPGARVLKTAQDITDWNSGKVEVMLAHPASAGHGLNLQDGGHNIVWYGLPWSLELYQQANGRLHRQGQTRPVVVTHIIAEDTMDEAVLKALKRKGDGQSALLEAVSWRKRSVTC